ncbi:hypothetical protein D3C76_705260 [compost metagenome]
MEYIPDLKIKYPGLLMSRDGYTYKGYDIIHHPKYGGYRVELNGVTDDRYTRELEEAIKNIICMGGK